MNKNKKILIGIGILAVIVVIGAFVVWFKEESKSSEEKCEKLLGDSRNIPCFYGALEVMQSNISEAVEMCDKMTVVPKRDKCYNAVALEAAKSDKALAKEICGKIENFQNSTRKEDCLSEINASFNLPTKIQSLKDKIQGKKPEEVYNIAMEFLGEPDRNIGSGRCIFQWDVDNGTLTMGSDCGGRADPPVFAFTDTPGQIFTFAGEIYWLIETENKLGENLIGNYEMTTAPDKYGGRTWLGNLELYANGTYIYKDVCGDSDIVDHNDVCFAMRDERIFFVTKPKGKYSIKYEPNLTEKTILENLKNDIVVAVLEFHSDIDAKISETSSVYADINERKIYFEKTGLYRLEKFWNNRWNYKESPVDERQTAQEQNCTNSGGTVSTGLCCQPTGDFPNTCLIGACGCASGYSHEVKTCDCGKDKCFDGTKCVSFETSGDKTQISEEQAIATAKENEKVKDFLRWFAGSKLFTQKTICDKQCIDIVCEGEAENCGIVPDDPVWIVSFYMGDKWDGILSARVLISDVSGKILSAESDYNYWYCEKDEDCAPENCLCSCINRVFKEKFQNEKCPAECKYVNNEGPFAITNCKCVNHKCSDSEE